MARKPMSKENRISFFKILVGDQIFTRLRVPPDFLNNYLKRIKFPTLSMIALKSDPEVSWKVKMEKGEGGHVYFTNGWNKVSKDMKLKIGDFMVFYLVGDDAAFEIRAYDSTCCEKMSGDDDDEEEDVDDDSEYADEEEEDDDDGDEEQAEEDEDKITEPETSTSKKRHWGSPHTLKANKKAEALGRAKSFVSTNPHFVMVMQPTYLYSSYHLRLPTRFLKTYNLFKDQREGTVNLHSENQIWPVRCRIEVYRTNLKARLFWKNFAVENELVVGDVCAFELMKNVDQVSFRITIFRA